MADEQIGSSSKEFNAEHEKRDRRISAQQQQR